MGLQRGKPPEAEDMTTTSASAATQDVVDDAPPFEADMDEVQADLEAERAAMAARPAGQPGQAIQPTSKSTAVAPSHQKGGIIAELAEEGFEGLEIGFGSFPIVKLENEGVFADTDGKELGKEFDCIILGSRTKYVVKNTKCEKKDEQVVYSYDLQTDTNGAPLQDTIDDWDAQGWGYETKPYLECPAQITGGDRDGDMVLLSIPKTSKNRLSGFIAQAAMRHRLKPNEFITRCKCGDKVTGVDYPFYPWNFAFVGKA